VTRQPCAFDAFPVAYVSLGALKILERAEPDLNRAMLRTFVDVLMDAAADALCGAPCSARTNSSNGYRPGGEAAAPAAILRLRSGSYIPDWLLERRRGAERRSPP
jgi:transposase-like protein